MAAQKRISGTKEWAKHVANIITGCPHGCKYCYSRHMMVKRYKKVSAKDWMNPVINIEKAYEKQPKRSGTIMFPSTSDIFPEVLDACKSFLLNLLKAGNDVLVVSKPHLACIVAICDACGDYKKQILFRFTIGAMDDTILQYWEPHAPNFYERLESLKYAHSQGYATSVSCEPMLDSQNVITLYRTLAPFVTDSIWIGKLNKIDSRVETVTEADKKEVARIKDGQTDDKITAIYNALKDEPKVKWKESIKEVIGLTLAEEAGLDE
jgi:DNA repair photolyase